MTRLAMDYSKTIIYKIVCNDLSIKDCYVGHTTDMTKRKHSHKSQCNNEKNKSYNRKIYQNIRENGGWENWSILLVEKFPCNDKREAEKREREVYEELEAKLNTIRPYRTQDEHNEYDKQYREENRDKMKQYREENKEEISEKMKQYYQEHKEELKEKNKKFYKEHNETIKQYREKNKDILKEKRNEKVECKYCSKLLSKSNMSAHYKSCKSKPVKE